MARGDFTFAVQEDGVPVTLIYFSVDESSVALLAGADGGRASTNVATVAYASPGALGADWRCYGLDPTFARLDGSLVSDTGPWADLLLGLVDTSPVDTARVLYVRLVAKRWAPDDASPRLNCSLSLGAVGVAGVEDP